MKLKSKAYGHRTLKARLDVQVESIENLLLDQGETADYIHIDHSNHGDSESNLLRLSREDARAKDLLVGLARMGYYSYGAGGGITKFVNHSAIRDLWHSVRNGAYLINDDDIVYTVTEALTKGSAGNLLVIFSSIGTDIYNPGLFRYFTQNYKSVQKFLPANTIVLRIADIGGVQGSFYLDTTYVPDNTDRIQRLISDVCVSYGIDRERVVLYGASKGGTGALYHGLIGDLRTVAVDPIVNDEHYVKVYGDTHFTLGGVFPHTKENVFNKLMDANVADTRSSEYARQVVICSERSPQYVYTADILIRRDFKHLAFYNTLHPSINDHPDVSPNSLDLAMTLINGNFYDLQIQSGLHTLSFDGKKIG